MVTSGQVSPENSPDFEESPQGSRVCLPKLIIWSQNFIATPHKLVQCDFGCWLGRDIRGDLELLQVGFRFVSRHGKRIEDGGLCEWFSSFTLRHFGARFTALRL